MVSQFLGYSVLFCVQQEEVLGSDYLNKGFWNLYPQTQKDRFLQILILWLLLWHRPKIQ